MFLLKVLPVVLLIQIVWTLSAAEDRFLAKELLNYFDDDSNEAIVGEQDKNAAIRDSKGEEKSAAMINSDILIRANHYWTRKRGRESTTFHPYTLYPIRVFSFNGLTNSNGRKKRQSSSKVSSKVKRQVEETEVTQAVEEQTPGSEHHSALSNNQSNNGGEQSKELLARGKHDERGKVARKPFAAKFNKCCGEETEVDVRNETLLLLKGQCMSEIRKNRKNFTAPDDEVEGNGGLYSMFSCNRISQWKTVVSCTMDCVAMKIGVIDSNGVVNVDLAKRVVRENAAKQKWEQDASDDLVEKCAKDVAASQSKLIDAFGYQCNSKASEFVYCMWRELFLTCPADKQTKSKQCEKLRTVLTKHSENKFKN